MRWRSRASSASFGGVLCRRSPDHSRGGKTGSEKARARHECSLFGNRARQAVTTTADCIFTTTRFRPARSSPCTYLAPTTAVRFRTASVQGTFLWAVGGLRPARAHPRGELAAVSHRSGCGWASWPGCRRRSGRCRARSPRCRRGPRRSRTTAHFRRWSTAAGCTRRQSAGRAARRGW